MAGEQLKTTTSLGEETMLQATPFAEDEKLSYEIYRCSSFSTNFYPENILVDCPSDQASRWSAHTNNPPQYLTLKLKRPAIVKAIKFGKFEKSHVCNIKKFRIYGGLEEEKMSLLLEGGLKNDNMPEVFKLRHIPILYMKIVPLLSWGPTFNFSIWYIELSGQDDPMYMARSMSDYNKLLEVEIVRLCLKHFRQQGYFNAFKALQEQTLVRLEDPIIGDLHRHLVLDGDFVKAEEFVSRCVDQGLMDDFLKRQDYKHKWQLQETYNSVRPGNRGGHQLVMDAKRRLIYLYGGWDGFQDLSDLWVYDIEMNNWSLLCERSEKVNGPTPRSCHKMVFDPISENIFMLGRYLDNSIRTTDYIKSDFFLYDTRARGWLQICDDTSQVGGPQLVYDHQMCIDVDKRTIFVFGGKVLTPRSVNTSSSSEPEYSGLFSYHIDTNTWQQILVDCHHPSASLEDVPSIKSRFTHCMVFHNKHRKLYIYGGQRGKEDMNDFIAYDVDTQAITVLNKENGNRERESQKEPSPGYTLRATIDCERDEIHIFSSLNKVKDRRDVQQTDASNSFWVYSLQQHKWSRIYLYRHNAEGSSVAMKSNPSAPEPCPRYAHQLVYDDGANVHYLFGGNPGKLALPQLRLNDFWILSLEKPKREEILRHCRYLLRKQQYEEMVHRDPYKAMEYLRHHVSQVIDHSNPEQLSNFHKLASLLFKPEDPCSGVLTATPPLGAAMAEGEEDAPHRTDASNDASIAKTTVDEDNSHKSDLDGGTNPAEDLSIESCESISTTASSGISIAASSAEAMGSGGGGGSSSNNNSGSSSSSRRARREHLYRVNSRRSFLFNKLVKLMPASMVQPERNLSDFVVV